MCFWKVTILENVGGRGKLSLLVLQPPLSIPTLPAMVSKPQPSPSYTHF
jgi:hypothetical protein